MRRVGKRQQPSIAEVPSSALLAEGARFSQSVAVLAGAAIAPKGVYRFKSHDEANRQQMHWLVSGMSRLAAERA